MARRQRGEPAAEQGQPFRPKVPRHHLACELQESKRPEVAREVASGLLPWAKDSALGFPAGSSKHERQPVADKKRDRVERAGTHG